MNEERSLPPLGSPKVVASARGDVTGDGTPDRITLTGRTEPGGIYVRDLVLSVRDGKSGRVLRTAVPFGGGYNPTLFLGDFTGNGADNILVQADTGGSGAITENVIYAYHEKGLFLIFDTEAYNEQNRYQVEYLDDFLVRLVSENNRMVYLLSIAYKGKEYLNEIYDSEGKLKQPIDGFVSPVSGLFPVDIDRDGVYELMAYQAVSGQYMADGLGYVQNLLKWRAMRFALMNQTVGIYGGQLK